MRLPDNDTRIAIVKKVINDYSTAYHKSNYGAPVPRTDKDILKVIHDSIYELLIADAQKKNAEVDLTQIKETADQQAQVIAQWFPVCVDSFLWASHRL